MANSDDATRELAECDDCGTVYTARRWPDGTVQTIGTDACSCGSTEFTVVESVGDDVPSTDE